MGAKGFQKKVLKKIDFSISIPKETNRIPKISTKSKAGKMVKNLKSWQKISEQSVTGGVARV